MQNIEAERALWRQKADQAWLQSDFESALGWARTALWGMGREMQIGCGRNRFTFASGMGAPQGPLRIQEELTVLEIGFFTVASDAADPQTAMRLMRAAFRPVAQKLAAAGPAAKKATFWMPRLAPVDAPVRAEAVGSMMERQEILGALPSPGKRADAKNQEKKTPPARRL